MNLNQVTIVVRDVPHSINFYETLGLKLIVHTDNNYARFECPEGDATFSLEKGEPVKGKGNITVYFEIDNLDTFVVALMKKGIELESLPEDKPWLWREASLYDPDDNKIILFTAGINRKNPPWRLNN